MVYVRQTLPGLLFAFQEEKRQTKCMQRSLKSRLHRKDTTLCTSTPLRKLLSRDQAQPLHWEGAGACFTRAQ